MSTFIKSFIKAMPLQALIFLVAIAANADVTGGPKEITIPLFGTVACKAYNCFFSSDTILVFSALAIFSLGVMVMLGKVQWNTVLMLTLGITILSGAALIVENMNSNPNDVNGMLGTLGSGGYVGCPSDKSLFTCK